MEDDNPSFAGAEPLNAENARVITPAFGLGRWAPFQYERDQHTTMIRPFWGRILLWLLVLACVGWVAVSGGLYGFVKYKRGFTEVRYVHMLLLPWKLQDYRRAKGEFAIKQGLASAEAHEWRQALGLLRSGLKAVPDNQEARLMVARIYLMAGRPDMTRDTLIEGLKYHGAQLDYLRDVVGFFFGLEADTTIIELMSELRQRLDPATPAGRMAATALAYAYFNRGLYKEAVAVLDSARLRDTLEGHFVTARIAWMKGRHEEALYQLNALTTQAPDNNEFYGTLIAYLREDRRWGEMRRASLLRQFAMPNRPEAYVDFIEACGQQGDEAGRGEAEAAFLTRFNHDAGALLKLGELASHEGRVDVAGRVAARCRELKSDEAESALLWLGAYLEQRDYEGMLDRCAELAPQTAKWPDPHRMILGGLRAAAFYGLHEETEAEPLADRLVGTKLLPAQTLTALAIQLQAVGQGEKARQLLSHAVELDPLNQPALVLFLRGLSAEGRLEEALPLIERLLGMRNPPKDLLADVATALDSDRYLFLADRAKVRTMIQEFLSTRNLRG